MVRDRDHWYTPNPPYGGDPQITRWVHDELQRISKTLFEKAGMIGSRGYWQDNTAEISVAPLGSSPPTRSAFGPTGITSQYQFNRGENVLLAFHIKHDSMPDGVFHPHVHWSTDGTAATAGVSDVVAWKIEWMLAKGHQQESFTDQTPIIITQNVFNSVSGPAPNPDPWHHYIAESATGIPNPEVDSLLLVNLSRGAAGDGDTYSNTVDGHVFGLYMDLHYQVDRIATPQKAPDFYT